jgi:uncharacterized protein (TIGR03067 family)
MILHLVIALAAGILIATDAAKDDLNALQGTWSLVSDVRDGKDVPDDVVSRTTLVIKGDRFTFPEDASVGTGPSGTFQIDPSRTPKAIDSTPSSGPRKGETWLGIYEVDGDLYKANFAPPGKPRPGRFASEPGSGHLHSVWRRGRPGSRPEGGTTGADLARLQGRWTIASITVNGRAVEDTQFIGSRFDVKGERYKVTLGEQDVNATFKLDPAGTRKTIDITYRDEADEGRTFKGIYRLEGDTFMVCRPIRPEGERPSEFAAPADSGLFLMVLNREKP